MRKAILLAFEIGKNNNLKYIAAMELAKERRLPLICFTTVSHENTEADLDEVYLHLLQLNGFYQSQFDNEQPFKKVTIKKIIKKGCFQEELHHFIENMPFELLLFQWQIGEV